MFFNKFFLFFSKGFDYSVASGTSVALVGQSGCGKSTVLQLVQRFYDPTQRSPATSGCILFDNKDLKDLAPTWIRRQIGVVSQEPNLLDLTIAENIAYGLTYQETPPSMDQIIEAAKQANAHEFISNLPLVSMNLAFSNSLINSATDYDSVGFLLSCKIVLSCFLDQLVKKHLKSRTLILPYDLGTIENDAVNQRLKNFAQIR